jgi:hypothetical protein
VVLKIATERKIIYGACFVCLKDIKEYYYSGKN